MISSDLFGGLGNQMFQIAVTSSLAKDNNDSACFDISGHDLGMQGFRAIKYKNNIFRKITDYKLENPKWYVEPKQNKYNEIQYFDNLKLYGYFQTPKYFHHNEKYIKELFSITDLIKDKLKLFISNTNLNNKITVSCHIRRGDYLGLRNIHPFVGIRYINESISNFNNCFIYVISDDINWCKNNIKSENNDIYFVDEFDDYEQLYLMSLCDHNIISNSTFGWWGSYLNNNENKIVIAPSVWFGEDYENVKNGEKYDDIYLNTMKIIDNSKYINIENTDKIEIISAYYGPKNVLKIFTYHVENNNMPFKVSNDIFEGDPLVGVPKYLNIIYTKNGVIKEESFKEDNFFEFGKGGKIKKIFNLIDDSFAHDNYCVAGVNSEFIQWDRTLSENRKTFYSNGRIPDIRKEISKKEDSYGFLFESRAIENYDYYEQFIPKFEKFFTHSSDFLKKYDNCIWIPGGGIWVGGIYGKGEIKITEKTKLCSIVSSNKTMCKLHNFRLEIVNHLKNSKIDIFGLDNWKPIYESLENYMFSIVVENFQDELYFTEKLMNCFATGTIPIYLGAKNINEKFNIDGILSFNSLDELDKILENLSEDLYYSKMDSILDNFERCKQYRSLEDYIFNNYLKY